jgi:Haemolymph juvenile hormone binding protein (JHBP).
VSCYLFCIIVPDKQMNAFLNENWSDLYNEISPSLFSLWSQIIVTIFSGFDKLVPFDEIFPENIPE